MKTNRIDIRKVAKNGTEMPTLEECEFYLQCLEWEREENNKYKEEEPEDNGIVYNAAWYLKEATKMLNSLNVYECTREEIIRKIKDIICDLATAGADLAGDSNPSETGVQIGEAYMERLIDSPDLLEEVIIDEESDMPDGTLDYGFSFRDLILADDEEPEIELQEEDYNQLEESCDVTHGYCPFN